MEEDGEVFPSSSRYHHDSHARSSDYERRSGRDRSDRDRSDRDRSDRDRSDLHRDHDYDHRNSHHHPHHAYNNPHQHHQNHHHIRRALAHAYDHDSHHMRRQQGNHAAAIAGERVAIIHDIDVRNRNRTNLEHAAASSSVSGSYSRGGRGGALQHQHQHHHGTRTGARALIHPARLAAQNAAAAAAAVVTARGAPGKRHSRSNTRKDTSSRASSRKKDPVQKSIESFESFKSVLEKTSDARPARHERTSNGTHNARAAVDLTDAASTGGGGLSLHELEHLVKASSKSENGKHGRGDSHGGDIIGNCESERGGIAASTIKPVFMSRKEREKLALQRLEAKRAMEATTGAGSAANSIPASHRRHVGRLRGADAAHHRTLSPSAYQKRDHSGLALPAEPSSLLDEAQRGELRARYLGLSTDKVAKAKRGEAAKRGNKKKHTKFVFDWDASEDTAASQFNDPLFKQLDAPVHMFGRGHQAGIDHDEATLKYSFYSALVSEREALGLNREANQKVRALREAKLAKRKRETLRARRHWREKNLDEMEERDWRIFREDFDISVRGEKLPLPARFWEEISGLPPPVYETLNQIGYTDPTPIQRAAIPIGLLNRDLIGIAQTGSGKTAAFVLPLLAYVDHLPRLDTPELAQKGPYAVIMAPTRELASQIAVECQRFATPMGVRCISIIGGESMEVQRARLRDGAEVIAATPGRLNEMLVSSFVVLNQCNYIVLDEADRMLDMGFLPQITDIMEAMPSSNVRPADLDEEDGSMRYRQTMMFSATMAKDVEKLAQTYLRNPAMVAIGSRHGKASKNVEQRIFFVPETDKQSTLLKMLRNPEAPRPIIIFVNAKKNCDVLARFLESKGVGTSVLHGDKRQHEREHNLARFKDGRVDVLVATDVAGRGIDVSGVAQVINYDFPSDIQRYTHRIGRTGRAGLKGVATTFLTDSDSRHFYDLKELLLESSQVVPHALSVHPDAKKKPGSGFSDRKRDFKRQRTK